MKSPLETATRERLLDLAALVVDGQASSAHVADLESILAENPTARREYLRYTLVHGQLPLAASSLPGIKATIKNNGEQPASQTTDGSSALLPVSRRFAVVGLFLTVAATLLLAVGFWKGLIVPAHDGDIAITPNVSQADPAPVSSSSHYDNRTLPVQQVARLVSHNSFDANSQTSVAAMSSIAPTTFSFQTGQTSFESTSGAMVHVDGPAMFGADAPTGGTLFQGSVRARMKRPDATYTVSTSNLRIVDRGTEFRVTLLDQRRVEVEVLDGEVEVQARTRQPLFYWDFDAGSVQAASKNPVAFSEPPGLSLGHKTQHVAGIVGRGALRFDNQPDAFARAVGGRGSVVGSGKLACGSGITLEAMIVSNWTGRHGDYDTILRKEDGVHRILLSLQNDGNGYRYDVPDVEAGPCLSFGLHLEQLGYSELDMPLDGRNGRPTKDELCDGRPHHVVASYDSFTGTKAIFIDGQRVFEHRFPIGTLILNGGPALLEIGNHSRQESFGGAIDEVAIYDFALTADEVASHFTQASQGESYFKLGTGQSPDTRWQSVIRFAAGRKVLFDRLTGQLLSPRDDTGQRFLPRGNPQTDAAAVVLLEPQAQGVRF